MSDSPAVILFDELGNPIGVNYDGYQYRLLSDSRLTDGYSIVGVTNVAPGVTALKVDVVKSVSGGGVGVGGTSSNFVAPFPDAGTAVGFFDGYYMQGAKVFDLDTSGGTEFILGTNLRTFANGGSVEAGTHANPLHTSIDGYTNTVLYDKLGNPVSVIKDNSDGYYRLLTNNSAADVIPTFSFGNSTTTPLSSLNSFNGVSEDISRFVSIDVTIISDADSAIDGLVFEWSQDGYTWGYTDGGTFTVLAGIGQNYSLSPRAKYFRCNYTNGISAQTNFALSIYYYGVDRSSYRQNLATDILAQRSTDVVRAVLAAQKQGGAAQTNNYTNLQATTVGFLKVSLDTVVTPAVVIPTIIQTHSAGPSTGTNFMDTFVSNTVINNAIIVLVMQGQGVTGATYTFSDSQGNVYTKGATFENPSIGQIDLWYTNAIGGPLTVAAANFSKVSTVGIQLYEVSGLLVGATILDSVIVEFGNSTSLVAGPILTNHDNEFCVSAFVTSGSPSITPGSGWNTNFNAPSFFSESQTQSAAGSITGTATSSISEPYIGVLATFLPALVSRPIVTDASGKLIVNVDGYVQTNPNINVIGTVSLTKSFNTTTLSVSANVSNVLLLNENSLRTGATIYNDSTANLYVKLGLVASLSDYTVKMVPGAYYEVPYNYLGEIDGIWNSAVGNARVTELT